MKSPLSADVRGRAARRAAGLCLAGLLAASLGACRMYNLEKKLGPADAEFYDRVQYIITAGERKAFLEMPEAERAVFQEEFWKRRDPDTRTAENEFKASYFTRMKEADRIFPGEGRSGWMTDRGRIYILFGPPQERITQSPGESRYGRCGEIWYYGSFPVVFSDANCSGSYTLITLNLQHLHDMNDALDSYRRAYDQGKTLFDFRCRVETRAVGPERVEAALTVETPYSGLWLESVEGRLRTTLEVRAELRTEAGDLVWSLSRDEVVDIEEGKIGALKGKDFVLILPLVVTDKAPLLAGRSGALKVSVRNRTGGEEVKKSLDVAF